MPAFWFVAVVLLDALVSCSTARAAEPELLQPPPRPGQGERPLRLLTAAELPERTQRLAARLLPFLQDDRTADGGGAGRPPPSISGLETLQVLYDSPEYGPIPPDGNAVLVSWSEDGSQTSITVEVTGFEPLELTPLLRAGGRFVVISGFPRCDPSVEPDCEDTSFDSCRGTASKPNRFEFRVIGSGGEQSVCQEVLPSWPVANDAGFCCRPGNLQAGACEAQIGFNGACSSDTGSADEPCSVIVTGVNSGPAASAVFVLVGEPPDGQLALEIAATITEPSAVGCFTQRVSVGREAEYTATIVALLIRSHAFETTWVDPLTEESYTQLEGAFLGADVHAFLGDGVTAEVSCSSIASCSPAAVRFRRGFANTDSDFDLTDGVFLLNFLFLRGTRPSCLDAVDLDDSGVLDLSDALNVFNFLFLRAPPFPPPFTECGVDATDDVLDCLAPAPESCR